LWKGLRSGWQTVPCRRDYSIASCSPWISAFCYYLAEIVFLPGLFDLAVARHDWVSLEAMKVLEPLLARGGVRVIATGTQAGYRDLTSKAAPLALQFAVIPVLPPNDDEATTILRGVKQQYEQFHDVTFSDEAIVAALAASARFLRHRPLPDRALDLLDETGAYVSLRRTEGDSIEEREVRRRIRIVTHKMENAILTHDFARAREFSEQERLERQVLKQLLEQRPPGTAASGTVTAQDVMEVLAGRVGAPVSVVQNLIAQPDTAIDRIAKQLTALVPQGREWIEPLAAWLAGCSPEDAQKLAAAIHSAAEKPKE
jgi:ATP-dependent Clp protease ATP-binding subunit ClpA